MHAATTQRLQSRFRSSKTTTTALSQVAGRMPRATTGVPPTVARQSGLLLVPHLRELTAAFHCGQTGAAAQRGPRALRCRL